MNQVRLLISCSQLQKLFILSFILFPISCNCLAEVKRNRELHKIQRSANQSDEFSESSFNSKVGDVNNVGPTVTSLGERLYMRELLKVISKEAVPDIFYSWKYDHLLVSSAILNLTLT